jgi:hypothetical protein
METHKVSEKKSWATAYCHWAERVILQEITVKASETEFGAL